MKQRVCKLIRMEPPANEAGVLSASGETVPADGTAGYAKSCLFQHTDGAGVSDLLYVNIGTADSCDFNAVTVAS